MPAREAFPFWGKVAAGRMRGGFPEATRYRGSRVKAAPHQPPAGGGFPLGGSLLGRAFPLRGTVAAGRMRGEFL